MTDKLTTKKRYRLQRMFSISDETDRLLDELAARFGTSRSGVIERIVLMVHKMGKVNGNGQEATK